MSRENELLVAVQRVLFASTQVPSRKGKGARKNAGDGEHIIYIYVYVYSTYIYIYVYIYIRISSQIPVIVDVFRSTNGWG